MDHEDAIRSRAAERYVARELSVEEEDAFEEHFFDCPECAEDVRFELAFAANTRAAAGELGVEQPPAPAPHAGFWSRFRMPPALAFSCAANVALAAVLGYSLVNGPRRTGGAQLMVPYFAPGPTHGAADIHAIPAGATSYLVRFLPPAANDASYSYEVLNATGKRESSGSLKAPSSDSTHNDGYLYLQLPVGSLPDGIHTLVIHAGANGEIVSWSKFSTSR